MKPLATTFVSIVAALAVLVPAASAGARPLSDTQLSRSGVQQLDLVGRYVGSHPSTSSDLIERYVATRGLAPSPEALAARALERQPDLVGRYVGSHPSTSNDLVERYVATRGLAPSAEALAARNSSSGDGIEWGSVSVGAGVLLGTFLLAICALIATRRTRGRYASV